MARCGVEAKPISWTTGPTRPAHQAPMGGIAGAGSWHARLLLRFPQIVYGEAGSCGDEGSGTRGPQAALELSKEMRLAARFDCPQCVAVHAVMER